MVVWADLGGRPFRAGDFGMGVFSGCYRHSPDCACAAGFRGRFSMACYPVSDSQQAAWVRGAGSGFLGGHRDRDVYADMGHFGTRPIRLTWFGLVLPVLAIELFRARDSAAGTPRSGASSILRHGALVGHGSNGGIGHPGHYYRFTGRDQRRILPHPAGDSVGVPAAFEHSAHLRSPNRPDIRGPGELDAHGLHDRTGPRFSILQQACRRLRSGRHLYHADYHGSWRSERMTIMWRKAVSRALRREAVVTPATETSPDRP
jgi:hypothetical protein